LSSEEKARATESTGYFKVPLDARSLDYQIYFDKGQELKAPKDPYTSSNTHQLSVTETIDLIVKLPEFIKYTEKIKF
jgi:UDP-glucose 4-epimerase